MVAITNIEISRHELPLDPAFPPSWDSRPRTRFRTDIVKVHCDSGHVGIGSGDAMAGVEDYLDLFVGHSPLDMDRNFGVLENIAFHVGRPWPIDLALWDLAGKIKGKPVYRLLGGSEGRVRAYASTGVLRTPKQMAEQVDKLVGMGFPAIKIRFSRPDIEEDLDALKQVRDRIGDQIDLMVDCNQGWRMPWDVAEPWTFQQALGVARRLEDLGVYWMEEPLHRGDYAGMASLRAATGLKIAGAEMTREMYELTTLIERRCLDVLQPDCAVTGGITGLHRVGRIAKENGIIFTPHTWGNGVGLVANIHLTAGLGGAPYIEYPIDPPEWTAERRDFVLRKPILTDDKGWINLSDAAGFGIVLNEDILDDTRVG